MLTRFLPFKRKEAKERPQVPAGCRRGKEFRFSPLSIPLRIAKGLMGRPLQSFSDTRVSKRSCAYDLSPKKNATNLAMIGFVMLLLRLRSARPLHLLHNPFFKERIVAIERRDFFFLNIAQSYNRLLRVAMLILKKKATKKNASRNKLKSLTLTIRDIGKADSASFQNPIGQPTTPCIRLSRVQLQDFLHATLLHCACLLYIILYIYA